MGQDKIPHIYIKSSARPKLTSGKYKMKIKQELSGVAHEDKSFDLEKEMIVEGLQFEIPAEKVYALSPSNASVIHDAQLLPQISFHQKTLPWQRRSITDSDHPWMALLLIREEEMRAIELKQEPLSSLKGQQDSHLSFQFDKSKSFGKKEDDLCTILKLPVELFNKIAPLESEFSVLSHIRMISEEIDLNKSTDAALADQHKSVSVVTCNRLPENGVNHMFLVSLESLGEYFPETRGKSKLPEGIDTIGLVCLHQWSYTVEEAGLSFKKLTENLTQQPTRYALDDSIVTEEKLKKALVQGFVPVPHQLRNGQKTISWYRGPLTPHQVKNSNTDFMVYHSDHLERMDPELNMFDESYAAAWQLGRLLAMKDKGFLAALARWKEEHLHKEHNDIVKLQNLDSLELNPDIHFFQTEASQDEDEAIEASIADTAIENIVKPLLKKIFVDHS